MKMTLLQGIPRTFLGRRNNDFNARSRKALVMIPCLRSWRMMVAVQQAAKEVKTKISHRGKALKKFSQLSEQSVYVSILLHHWFYISHFTLVRSNVPYCDFNFYSSCSFWNQWQAAWRRLIWERNCSPTRRPIYRMVLARSIQRHSLRRARPV